MSTVVENINQISVEIEPKHSVTSQTGATVEIQEPEYIVHAQRKEYKVVGDNIYIPKLYDDAPQWMKDLIGTVVDIKTAVAVGNLDDALESLRTLATELEVAKNTYTMSIVSSNDIDQRINTAIETLNSSLAAADATILNIANTAVTPEEASAIAINTLSASLSASGEIGSFIANMNSAFADLESTTAQNIQYIESAIESEFSANATAINTIKTYVGIDDNGGKTGTGLLADVEIIQKQNDGIIETTTGTYEVMLNPQDPDTAQLVVSAEPYASWKAADITGIDTRLAHIGDVYIQYVSNTNGSKDYVASYKFIRTIADTTSPYATDTDGFTWALIIDQAAQDAYQQALNAYDLADNKRRVFVTTPTAPYDIGDLWIRVVNGSNQIWRASAPSLSSYSIAHWSLASTDDTKTIALQTGLANGTVDIKLSQAYVGTALLTDYVAQEIDKEVVVYSGTTADKTALTGMKINDIFIEKTTATGTSGVIVDVVNTYKYSGTAWVQIGNNSNLTALADLADGKRTIFSNDTSMPANPKIRDMWIPANTYLTYTKGEIYLYNGTSWVVATKYSADIAALTSNVQSQIDSKVDTYYQATVPFANATNVARRTSAGDYWYCTSTAGAYVKGKMYKYVESANGSNWNYTWTETADITKYAFDTADSKAAIYTTSNKPSTYNVRDMLIVITDNAVPGYSAGVMLTSTVTRTSGGFTNADWTKLVNDTEDLDDFVNSVYTPTINSLQTQVDAKIEYWFQSTDPKSAWTTAEERLKHNGDVWYNTTTKVSQYYSSQTNSWNIISDKDALDAIAAAEAARQLADSKVVVRYGTAALRDSTSAGWTSAEKTSNIGDIWIISDAGVDQYKQFRWTGTAWLDVRDKKIIANAEAITQLGIDITSEAGLRVAGDTAVTNTVKAYADTVGVGVETKWAYNSTVNIGGVYKKSGFGLTTNYTSGSGTQADPYVSEFWIDASRLKFTNSNMTGQVAPFTIDATGATPQITFNGKVSFTNVSDTQGSGTNLLYNSAPKIGNETKGWSIGWSNHGLSSSINGGSDPWKPTGGASVYVAVPGSPGIGTVFDINNSRFPVMANTRYEASAYISSHRCDSRVTLAWFDINGNYISESSGTSNSNASSGPLAGWSRSTMFATAPSNAATAQFYVRSVVTSNDPYCFVAYAYSGIASTNQTIPSNWSEGSSAGVSSGDVVTDINNRLTTTINGPRITTGSITAAQIQANSVSADKLLAGTNSTTVWTGGGLVSANFNGNPYGNIGTPTQGFRLSSGAAGTETDPNIYGAYIKGSTVDIETLSVKAKGYSGNSGRVVKYQKNGYIYMPGYGSGFLASRVCSQAESAVKVEGWYRAATNYLVAYLQYSTDGVNWANLAVKDAQQYGYQEYFYIYFAELFNPNLVVSTALVTFRIIGNVSGNASDILISIYNN